MAPADPIDTETALELLLAEPPRTAVLTDVDGTVAPITDRPEQTQVLPAAREALQAIKDRFGLVACISGRQAARARELVGIDGLTYSGNHGMETLRPDSREVEIALHLRGHQDAAGTFVAGLDPERLRRAGLRLEDKGPIQALHWRGAPIEEEAAVAAAEIAAESQAAGLEPHWGRKVLELRPPGGGGKGAAIQALLGESDIRVAVYAGDDRTDIDAFRCLRALVNEPGQLQRAICIGIVTDEGPPELAGESDLVLTDPDQWVAMLRELNR